MTNELPWENDDRRRLECVPIGPRELRVGDRVILRPRRRADVLDLALAGKTAVIEAIEQDFDDRIHLAVTIVDDPGREFGVERKPAHRFFFGLNEVEAS